jgi:ion channel-forming bestrophin family protein
MCNASFEASYDKYWMGRTCWSDIVRTSRTLARLIWHHVPARVTLPTGLQPSADALAEEIRDVTAEKRMALDLIEGCQL